MTEELSPSEQANELRSQWNPLPEDQSIQRLVGVNPPAGDTRATAHLRNPAMDHPGNVAIDRLDGGAADNAFTDDLDGEGDEGGVDVDEDGAESSYSDMSKEELQDEAERRGLAKSGTKKELVSRLEEDDESEEDDE